MAIGFKSMQAFVKNTIHPYIVNLRDLWRDDVAWLKSLIDALNARLTQAIIDWNNRLSALDTRLSSAIASVEASLNARLTQAITDWNNRLSALDTRLSSAIASVAASLDAHAQRKDNPHKVKTIQTVYGGTSYTTPPSDSQGEVGNIYIERIN